MKHKPITINGKTLEIPVVQGGMGIGISLGGLAGAVAKEGGAGTISVSQIGYREPDFYTNTLEANKRAIHKEMKKAREIAPKGIIGCNIMVAMNHYEENVKEIIAAGADFIVSGAGLPVKLPAYTKGSDIAIAPIVSTEKSANVILKYWDKKYGRTADFVVIEGPKAGGHLGFTKEQLEEYDGAAYDAEIRKIIAVIKRYEEKYATEIPVVVGGGISNREEAVHAMELGADAVQVASRFVTTKECDADEKYKQAYIDAGKEDIIIVKSPVGMPGRAIRNPFMERIATEGRIPPKQCLNCIHTCNPAETPYCITDALIQAAKGNTDNALLFCGAKAYEAKKMETVKEVMDSFRII